MHSMKTSHHHNPGSPFSDFSKRVDCNAKLPFICEKYNVSSLEKYSPDPASKVQCTGKWIPFQNKVRGEPLHCAKHGCFRAAWIACGRRAASQTPLWEGLPHGLCFQKHKRHQTRFSSWDAYWHLYSIVPRDNIAAVDLPMTFHPLAGY